MNLRAEFCQVGKNHVGKINQLGISVEEPTISEAVISLIAAATDKLRENGGKIPYDEVSSMILDAAFP